MTNENDLMMKLVTAKKIMNKHNEIGRGGVPMSINESPGVENFRQPNATYNIPQEYMNESMTMGHMQNDDVNYPLLSESAMNEKNLTRTYSPAPSERIMSSKLPDAIKQLMIEHPISQPSNPLNSNPSLSDELVEKASRLMGTQKPQQRQLQEEQRQQQSTPNFDFSSIKSLIESTVRNTVEKVLRENGLMVESTSKSNEQFKFKVGSHLFEGKVTKIRKVSE